MEKALRQYHENQIKIADDLNAYYDRQLLKYSESLKTREIVKLINKLIDEKDIKITLHQRYYSVFTVLRIAHYLLSRGYVGNNFANIYLKRLKDTEQEISHHINVSKPNARLFFRNRMTFIIYLKNLTF